MQALWIFIATITLSGAVFFHNQGSSEQMEGDSTAAAVAGNMMIFRNLLGTYLATAPTATGKIPDSSLNIPSWFRHDPNVSNYVIGGRGYVFYSGSDAPGLASELYARIPVLYVGTNVNGVLVSPAVGDTGITLPPQVPLNAVVIRQ
jgi:hypothetical protein